MNQPRNTDDSSMDESHQRLNGALHTPPEFEQSLQALQRGLADAEAGRLVNATEAINAARNRIQRTA